MDIIDKWKEKAKQSNMTMKDVAKVGDCDLSTLERWKNKLPKSLRTYLKIEEHFSED